MTPTGPTLVPPGAYPPPPPSLAGDDPDTSTNGTHVMVAGIVFQLVSMIVYSALTLHFVLRASRARRDRAGPADLRAASGPGALGLRPVKVLCWAIGLASLAIIIRGIYRTVELAEGWNGYALSTEVFTFVLDVSCPFFRSNPGRLSGR